MVGLAIFLLAISSTTINAAEDVCPPATASGPCKLSSTSCRPEITVENSTHLLVNWDKVFEGCKEEHVRAVKMFLTTVGKNKIELPSDTVDFNTKRVSIPGTPCLKHIISVKLLFQGSYLANYSVSSLGSSETNYNDKDKDKNYPFSGLLEEELAPKICMKDNGNVVVPASQTLKNCRLTVGEVEKTSQTGNKVTLDIAFNNPMADQSSVPVDVPNIKSCPKVTTQAPTQTPCPTCPSCPHETSTSCPPSANTESNSSGLWIGLGFIFGFLLGLLACWLRLFSKFRNNKNAKVTIFNFTITSCEKDHVERQGMVDR